MPAGVVVGGVLFAGDELLGVEQLAVGPGADLVDYGGLEIDEQSSGDVTTGTGFRKKVLKASSSTTAPVSWGMVPSGLMPCSRQ